MNAISHGSSSLPTASSVVSEGAAAKTLPDIAKPAAITPDFLSLVQFHVVSSLKIKQRHYECF
jgi:hypothetical protein